MGFSITLPMPPSVNKFVARLGNKSSVVRKWHKDANAHLMSKGRLPLKVTGSFGAVIIWDDYYFGKRDIDNSIKPLFDYLQMIELIDDDKYCRKLLVLWGTAPDGCIVEIEEETNA